MELCQWHHILSNVSQVQKRRMEINRIKCLLALVSERERVKGKERDRDTKRELCKMLHRHAEQAIIILASYTLHSLIGLEYMYT